MREIPIIFQPEMVKAILAGRKTQTRRIVKAKGVLQKWIDENEPDIEKIITKFRCPYGEAGDLLYVRENFKLVGWDYEEEEAIIQFTDGAKETMCPEYSEKFAVWLEREIDKLERKGILIADEPNERFNFTDKHHPFSPSIHLPKWGSRIWLQKTGTRVERLQSITVLDAYAEGVHKITMPTGIDYFGINGTIFGDTPVEAFNNFWDELNGKESREANPWVWVNEFKVV